MTNQHDETGAALIRAAHAILERSGLEALTVRRIAAEAGVSTMNVYSRFQGKTGVVDELYAAGYQRLAAAMQAVPTTGSALADLAEVLHAYRRFALGNPTYYRIMFRSSTVASFEPSTASETIARTCLDSLRGRVARCRERGDLGNGVWSADEIATWLWATVHGLVSLELDGEADDGIAWERVYQLGVQAGIAGLAQTTGTAQPTGTVR